MQIYRAKGVEYMREGLTHLFKVLVADFAVGFNNQQIVLTALAAGDTVMGGILDSVTTVTGPTGAPTAQLKVNTANKAITPTLSVTDATKAGVTTDNTVVGGFTLLTGADNLVLDLQAGGGNSAAAVTGEVWVWAHISRQADRLQLQA